MCYDIELIGWPPSRGWESVLMVGEGMGLEIGAPEGSQG